MKNQYFGDINDYKKYGLLKLLNGHGQLKTVVCWMLTHDDKRTDGNRISYLKQPDKWGDYDPSLFNILQTSIRQSSDRNVKIIESSDILLNTHFYSEIIEDKKELRELYFDGLFNIAKGSDFIFFDPDNGLEVKSVPYGKKNSSKYLYWHELQNAYESDYSILLYQHFPRMNRKSYIENLVQQFSAIVKVNRLFYYQTRHVVFFLLPQPKHERFFIDCNADILNFWGKTININELYLKSKSL